MMIKNNEFAVKRNKENELLITTFQQPRSMAVVICNPQDCHCSIFNPYFTKVKDGNRSVKMNFNNKQNEVSMIDDRDLVMCEKFSLLVTLASPATLVGNHMVRYQ